MAAAPFPPVNTRDVSETIRHGRKRQSSHVNPSQPYSYSIGAQVFRSEHIRRDRVRVTKSPVLDGDGRTLKGFHHLACTIDAAVQEQTLALTSRQRVNFHLNLVVHPAQLLQHTCLGAARNPASVSRKSTVGCTF